MAKKQIGQYRGTDITEGTDENVAQQVADIDSAMGISEMNGTSSRKPNLPTPVVSTAVPNFLGNLESTTDAFTQDLTQRAKDAEIARNDSFADLYDDVESTDGAASYKDRLYRKNVDPLEEELININNQIRGEQHGLRREIERIDKNSTGVEADALQALRGDAERRSLSKQADLAVLQLAQQGRFDSAEAIAARAVEAKLDEDKRRNELLQLAYQENKELFTTAEQRLFETKQKDRNTALEVAAEKEMVRYREMMQAQYSTSGGNSGGGSGFFTNSQLGDGAANAGVPIAEFKGLDDDTKNFFVNGYTAFSNLLKERDAGNMTGQEILDFIQTSNLSESTKNILRRKLGVTDENAESEDTGTDEGWMGKLKAGAGSFISNLFGI